MKWDRGIQGMGYGRIVPDSDFIRDMPPRGGKPSWIAGPPSTKRGKLKQLQAADTIHSRRRNKDKITLAPISFRDDQK
jgi:hypothetical protein